MNASAKAETEIQRIVALIEAEAQKRFKDAAIERVIIDDTSDEGDTLKVFVVVGDTNKVDPKKVVGFLGSIKDVLEKELSDDRFPLISYFSKAEAEDLFSEAR